MEAGGSKTDSSLGASGYKERHVIILRDDKGFGLTVRGDKPVYVECVKAGGAAERAGVQQGDRIVKVNGTLVTDSSHNDVTKLIKSNSLVVLSLIYKSNDQLLDLSKDATEPLHRNECTQAGSLRDSVKAQQDIIAMEDDEFADEDYSGTVNHGAFSSLKLLESRPSHLAVFLNYVMTHSKDPSSLLFYIVSGYYRTTPGTCKELKKWALEIYSTFLVAAGSPLKLNVDESISVEIDNVLVYRNDKEDILHKVFDHARASVQTELQNMLHEFCSKKEIGFGNMFGIHELKDIMKKNEEIAVVEKYVMPHLDRCFKGDGGEDTIKSERELAMGWALNTFLRNVGVKRHNSSMDRVQSFIAKDKRLLKIGQQKKKTAMSNLVQKIRLQLAATPILEDDNVPAEIKLMSDRQSVPLYLRLLESGSEKKRDIRLVIVGEKGAGKTSFIKRLFGEDIRGVASTNGIDIHRIKCHAESNDGIWNKLEGKSAEAELYKRLLKAFEKSLKNQIKVNSKATTEEVACKIIKDNKPPTSYYDTKTITINDATFPSLVELTKATVYHGKPPGQSSKQAHNDVERVLKSSLDKLKRTHAIGSHEMLYEHPLEQAQKEIERMLKSKVDLHDEEEYATLLLWDFAGDEEFYHTHQTFLSADAIYLVVTKLNEADNKGAQGMFRLWMDSIHCYCRSEKQNTMSGSYTAEVNELTHHRLDPPVILIGTCKDQIEIVDGEEVQNACMKRLCEYTAEVSLDACRHIVEEGKFCISNTKDDTTVFQEIREYISKLLRTMPSWNRAYPLKFINLEKCLQEKRLESPIISFHQIQNLSTAISNPLTDEELNLFLRFHHEIRALVYFEDLPDYIILDTQWLSDAFKCIVTAEKFQWKVRSIQNKDKWENLNQRGILHSEVLEDIFKKQKLILSQHKDHILNVMEKFDILIRPIVSVEDVTAKNSSYYVPCMMKEKPERHIYEMFNVTKDTCKKSTWVCLKFSFLPPHLMHHLIASLCREYEVSKVFDTIQNKKVIALFRGSAVFDLQNTRLQKLLVTVCPNLIQIQVLEFNTNAVIVRGSFSHIADFVEEEIIKIISTRFKMTSVTFEKKWECGSVNPESVTGSNDFTEDQNTEYFCETCTALHKLIDEWSNKHLSDSFEESNSETVDSNRTVLSAKLYLQPETLRELNLSEVQTRKKSSRVLSKEEFNFAKMGMIVVDILADVLFDLLKQDIGNVKPRSECDITYLYGEHRNLNKHIPSNSGGRRYPWGGTWHDKQNTDIATGDDIERIRLTRNEIQHSETFKLDDTRYNDLCNIIDDLLKRFDQRNNPSKLYTEQLQEILNRTLSDEEVNGVQSEMAIEIEIEHQVNIPP